MSDIRVRWRFTPSAPPQAWYMEPGHSYRAGRPPMNQGYVRGGHIDPGEADRFEAVLEAELERMTPEEAEQWELSFKPRRRRHP